MRMKRIVTAMLAGCAAVVMAAVPELSAQTPQDHQHAATDKAKPGTGMAAKDHAMMADMKAADQRLDDLVVKMNSASGVEKTAATAIVVTEMVTQRRTMRDGMMKMQDGMMRHMMEHMQAGAASLAMCPLMKPAGETQH